MGQRQKKRLSCYWDDLSRNRRAQLLCVIKCLWISLHWPWIVTLLYDMRKRKLGQRNDADPGSRTNDRSRSVSLYERVWVSLTRGTADALVRRASQTLSSRYTLTPPSQPQAGPLSRSFLQLNRIVVSPIHNTYLTPYNIVVAVALISPPPSLTYIIINILP